MASLPHQKFVDSLNRPQFPGPVGATTRTVTSRFAAVLLVVASVFASFSTFAPIAVAADDWIDDPEPLTSSGLVSGAETNSFVARPSVSAAQAAARVRQLHGGRVLSVSPSRRGDSLGYRVRVLVDGGRVKTIYVRSGQVNAPSGSDRSAVRTIGDG